MEDYVSFELAKKLKEKGFSERTFGAYVPPVKLVHFPLLYSLKNWNKEENVYSAPTISQVLKWLREEKKIHISIMLFMFKEGWCYEISKIGDGSTLVATQRNSSDTYEDAALAGIEYVLNLI